MKILLSLLLVLTVPLASRAQCPTSIVVSDAWTSYCDNGVARARYTLSIVTVAMPSLPPDLQADFGAVDSNDPGLIVIVPFSRIETVAPGYFQLIAEHYPLANFPSGFARHSYLVRWMCDELPIMLIEDGAGPFPVPGVTCSPLPIAISTWGAVKALYR